MANKYFSLPTSNYSLLTIVGPTASGKSALAMIIAQEFNGEIISADSWQVYKGFDIGASKPTKNEQQAVKHHLIDVAEPPDGFNAPKFKILAENAIENIQKRGKLPILAGGTGLYIDSVLYNYGFLPNLSHTQRAKLDAMSLDELLTLAGDQKIDLAGVDTRNKRRLVRAIEAGGQKPTKNGLRVGTLIVGINPTRQKLRKFVEKRIDVMIKNGLEQETKSLVERYGWDIEPMKGIGYKEWRPFFEGLQNIEETKTRIIKNSMDLAKRQMTWFKRNADIKWFDNGEDAYAFLTKHL